MSMIEVKTAELIGPALDWAVAEAEGIQRFDMGNDWPGNSVVADAADRDRVVICNMIGQLVVSRGGWSNGWNPSTDWAQGGPLIEKYAVKIEHFPSETIASKANARIAMHSTAYWQSGPTPLVALCRAIVAAKLGDAVSVPAELVQQQGEGGGK